MSTATVPQDIARIKTEVEFCMSIECPLYFQPEKLVDESEEDYWWRVQDSVLDFLIEAVDNDSTGKIKELIDQYVLTHETHIV